MEADARLYSCKPGDTEDRWPQGARRGEEGFYPESREEHGPAGTSISDLLSPELWDDEFLLF